MAFLPERGKKYIFFLASGGKPTSYRNAGRSVKSVVIFFPDFGEVNLSSSHQIRNDRTNTEEGRHSPPMKRRDRLALKAKKKHERIARRHAREREEEALTAALADNMPTRPGRPGLTVLLENIPLPTNAARQLATASYNGNGTGHF